MKNGQKRVITFQGKTERKNIFCSYYIENNMKTIVGHKFVLLERKAMVNSIDKKLRQKESCTFLFWFTEAENFRAGVLET